MRPSGPRSLNRVFHRQLHRQIGRLLALKDAIDVGGGAASMAYLIRPI